MFVTPTKVDLPKLVKPIQPFVKACLRFPSIFSSFKLENSKVPEKEQIRILQLLEDYYRMRNMNDLDVVLSNLIKSVLEKDYDVKDNPEIE